MKRLELVSWCCAAALAVACSSDTPRDPAAAASTDVDRGDMEFVREMLETGTAEIQLGKLASARASSPDVKKFGDMLVSDHEKSADRLEQIATSHGVQATELPLSDDHTKLLDRLSKLSGPEFDREYVAAMVDGHENVVDKLQRRVDERDRLRAATGQAPKDVDVNPEPADNALEASLNQWAADTLPVVKGHLEQAKNLDDVLDRRKTALNR